MSGRAVAFRVRGVPVERPRQRFGMDWRSGRARSYTRREHPVHGWKEAVALGALEQVGRLDLRGPLEVRLVLLFPRLASARKRDAARRWKASKPDPDNLAKPVLDALQGVLFAGDHLVARLVVDRMHVALGEEPGAEVEVRELEP